jgi:hypothetical protein
MAPIDIVRVGDTKGQLPVVCCTTRCAGWPRWSHVLVDRPEPTASSSPEASHVSVAVPADSWAAPPERSKVCRSRIVLVGAR